MDYYKLLEYRFTKMVGYKYAISLNSGTSALHLALLAMGVGKDDEVIVPDFTFASCAFSVSYCNATPIFVDCDGSLNIDVNLIEEKITSKTKVIMAVHIYGRRCNMEKIKEIAAKHNLLVLEDLSEAHGIQPSGDVAIYSFQSSKIIHAEEGGVLLTNNTHWSEDINYLKSLSNRGDYYHSFIGFNYRMPDSQAKLALKSLSKLNANLKKRRKQESVLIKKYGAGVHRDVVWVFDLICESEEERDKMLKEIPKSRHFFKPMSSLPMYNQPIGKNALKYSKLGLVIPLN